MSKFFTAPATQANLLRRVSSGQRHAFVSRLTYEDRIILDCLGVDMMRPHNTRDRFGAIDRYLATLNL
jgi:hypothetical protein